MIGKITREEVINQLEDAKDGYQEYLTNDAIDMAIEALEQRSCEDCIRRSDISLTDFEIAMCNGDYKEGLKMLLDKVKNAPSVTPQLKIGYWTKVDDEEPIAYDCSECAAMVSRKYNYCPRCGAKMEVKDADSN